MQLHCHRPGGHDIRTAKNKPVGKLLQIFSNTREFSHRLIVLIWRDSRIVLRPGLNPRRTRVNVFQRLRLTTARIFSILSVGMSRRFAYVVELDITNRMAVLSASAISPTSTRISPWTSLGPAFLHCAKV